MKVLIVFIQIIMFPTTILIASLFLNKLMAKRNPFLSKICYATNFTTVAYVIGGIILFPLYFVLKPIKINGITYLTGSNLWIYWLLSFIIITPVVYATTAYFLYFKKVSVVNYFKESLLLGLYSISLSLILEIVIYVYWRKTIPSTYFYFFGKNFPWIDINWVVAFISIFIAAFILKAKKTNDKVSINY